MSTTKKGSSTPDSMTERIAARVSAEDVAIGSGASTSATFGKGAGALSICRAAGALKLRREMQDTRRLGTAREPWVTRLFR